MAEQTDRIRRMMDLFMAASRLEHDERDGYVIELTGDDEDLRHSVRRLLEAEDQVRDEDFLEPGQHHLGSLLPQDGLDPDLGRHVGPYRLLRQLGSGGMGTVYEAVRRDDFQQIVAIKLIKRGLDTEAVLRRFLYERQTLAALNHPNIARLLDGGTDDDLPYFAMEYVRGMYINEYCDRHKLSLRQRVELMLPVCEAVAYAHEHIVVHRDIKPANILVDAHGRPKLLDFGLAKVLSPELSFASSDVTQRGERYVTLSYASPEQLQGDTVGKPVDVYSLGVVLFELLTGQKPFWLDDLSWDAAERIVGYRVPPRPSAVVRRTERVRGPDGVVQELSPLAAATARSTTAEQLHRALRGDLDNIVLTCLRKEPRDRYADAGALADDLRRHLEDRPIKARPVSLGYATRKFVRRNRIMVRWAAGLSVALLLALVTTSWALVSSVRERDTEVKRRVAERERSLAERERAQLSDRALSKRLAAYTVLSIVDDPELRLLLSIEANDVAPTPIAAYALRKALSGARRVIPPLPYTGLGGSHSSGPAGRHVVTAGAEGLARVFDERGVALTDLPHESEVRTVAFASDGVHVVTCDVEGVLRLWNAQEGRLEFELFVSDAGFRSASYTPDGRWIVAMSDRSATIFDPRGVEPAVSSIRRPIEPRRTTRRDEPPLTARAESDGSISLLVDTRRVASLTGHWSPVAWLALDPTGQLLASASEDTTGRIWDLDGRAELSVLRPNEGPLDWTSFSPDGRWLLTASTQASVAVWHVETGELLREQSAYGAIFTPDSEWLIIMATDGAPDIVPWEMFAPPALNLAIARSLATRSLTDDEREEFYDDLSTEDRRRILRKLTR